MSAVRASSTPVPPWPTTVAALLSLAILAVGSGPSPALLIPLVGLLAVYVVPVRVERATRTVRLTRLVLIVLALALNAGHQTVLMDAWGPAPNLNALAQVFGAEMTLRAWHRPANSRQMLLLSGLIVLVGCCTQDDRVGLYLVPAYFAFVILALRADRARRVETAPLVPRLMRVLAVLVALGLGAIAQWSFRVYKDQIVAWGSSVLDAKPAPRDSAQTSGIAKDPILGPTFGSPGSSARILRLQGTLPDPHLHGMAFDTYTRGTWQPSLSSRRFFTATSADLHSSASGPRVQITRLVNDDGMVSAPLSSAGLDLGPAEPTWASQQGGPLRLETPDPLTYHVIVGPSETYQGPFCAPPDAEERSLCLAVPAEVDPGVVALAQKIAGRLTTPQQKVEAVEDYLLQNNAYSLTTRPGPGDPVSNFILLHKAAHCEFFASAAAVLLRCVGVPTRYVIGYYAHESAGPGETVVRGQDAHAWDESWVDGVGWVVVDATPGNGRPDQTAKTPFWWKIRDRWQDLTLALQTAFAGLTTVRRLALVGGLVVLLLIPSLVRALRSRRRSLTLAFTYAPLPSDLGELAARFEGWLARQGTPCPPERPWQEHVEQPEAQAFIASYNRARFGEDAQAPAQADEALRQLESRTSVTAP